MWNCSERRLALITGLLACAAAALAQAPLPATDAGPQPQPAAALATAVAPLQAELPANYTVQEFDWLDATRQREVPVRLYLPRAATAGHPAG